MGLLEVKGRDDLAGPLVPERLLRRGDFCVTFLDRRPALVEFLALAMMVCNE